MIPVSFFHKCVRDIPPPVAVATLILSAAAITLVVGLIRKRLGFIRYLPAIGYVAATSSLLLPINAFSSQGRLRTPMLLAAGFLLIVHQILRVREEREEGEGESPGSPPPGLPLRGGGMESDAALQGGGMEFDVPPQEGGMEFNVALQGGGTAPAIDEAPIRQGTRMKWIGWIRRIEAPRVYLGAILVATGLFLFDDLAGFSGSLLTWESEVSRGFGDAFHKGQGVWAYTGNRFLWAEGLMSSGQNSLLYGAPTYALFHAAGFNPWILRAMSPLLTLGSIVLVYLIGRRFFSPLVGGAMAALYALSEIVLYYGKYGTSAAGTFFGLLLAVYCTWLFLADDKKSWWMGPACGLSLYLATLQYSTARMVVLILLGLIAVVTAYNWRRFRWRRAVGTLLLLLVVVGVYSLEKRYNVHRHYSSARGEQFLNFMKNRNYLREYLHREVDPRQITRFDKFELLYRVLAITIPQYAGFFTPDTRVAAPGTRVVPADPPPLRLFQASMAPFLIWGFLVSLVRMRAWTVAWRDSWKDTSLLLWIVLLTPPLLLTNRVDAHRIFLFVAPFMMWSAFGMAEAAHVMGRAGVPRFLQHLCATALVFTFFAGNVNTFFYDKVPVWEPRAAIAQEIENVPGPLLLGVQGDHKDVSWLNLVLLERERKDPARKGSLLEPRLLDPLLKSRATDLDAQAGRLEAVLEESTLVLAPYPSFARLAQAMDRRGVRVTPRPPGNPAVLRIDSGAEKTGVTDDELAALPDAQASGVPGELQIEHGTQVFLSELDPENTSYGFAPPQLDKTWANAPIRLGGVTYAQGIGMHAWCRMTFPVPGNADLFQSLIGISDDIRSCKMAKVTFEILDQNGRLLYKSGVMDFQTPPKVVKIRMKDEIEKITLVVTEADNGKDCDHADWAMASFVLKEMDSASPKSLPKNSRDSRSTSGPEG